MRKIVLFLATILLSVACNCPHKEQNTTVSEQKTEKISLIGEKATLVYPSLTAEVHYISENEIHWKTTDDQGQVAEQKNTLVYKPINATQFFLNWVEDDGTTVSQVIDTEKKTVSAFLTYSDETGKRIAQFLEGTFQINK
ncbi:MAG: hypothetical protein Q3983_01975 [Capnocytophaga sp.]|nr:hypothetical protein [Capnocytophaga sp.]